VNQEALDLWLKALRSRRYRKVRGGMCMRDAAGRIVGHCALGVLVEEAIKAGVTVPREPGNPESGDGYDTFGEFAYWSEPPPEVRDWTAWGDGWKDVIHRVINLNDDKKHPVSFRRIANVIEECARTRAMPGV